jgi:hypothetical protein
MAYATRYNEHWSHVCSGESFRQRFFRRHPTIICGIANNPKDFSHPSLGKLIVKGADNTSEQPLPDDSGTVVCKWAQPGCKEIPFGGGHNARELLIAFPLQLPVPTRKVVSRGFVGHVSSNA